MLFETGKSKASASFFEKKEAKNFLIPSGRRGCPVPVSAAPGAKVFWFPRRAAFFQKRTASYLPF
jgi:hypothetical protein